jgi:hypothetical protein
MPSSEIGALHRTKAVIKRATAVLSDQNDYVHRNC